LPELKGKKGGRGSSVIIRKEKTEKWERAGMAKVKAGKERKKKKKGGVSPKKKKR